jgi:MFS family permease
LATDPDAVALSTPLTAGFAIILAITVTGFAFVTPSVQSLISRRSDADRQGEVLGINQSAAAMARILGPLVGLLLFKLEATHVLPYAFAAGLLVVLGFFSWRLR